MGMGDVVRNNHRPPAKYLYMQCNNNICHAEGGGHFDTKLE